MAEHDWWEKPTQPYYAYHGTLMNTEVEKSLANDPLAAGETRLFWFLRLDGQVIGLSGQPDLLIYVPAIGVWKIVDYKIIKEILRRTYCYICPICGADAFFDLKLSSRVRGAGWRCSLGGSAHYWEDRGRILA